MDLFALGRPCAIGLLLLAACLREVPAGEAAAPAAPGDLRYSASAASDWRLDSLANYLHLKRLCENNLRHAEQELAAFGKRTAKPGETPFTLQKLLQGQAATLDLARPYQVHIDAAEIGSALTGATAEPGSKDLMDEPEYMRARQFHLRQKIVPGNKPGAQAMWLTLDAKQADFGIIASATNDPTGQQRTMGHTHDMLRDPTQMLSWPFVVDLTEDVRVAYFRKPGAAGPGAVAATATPGVLGNLAGLTFQAPRIQTLLAGDGRAGRSLFWAPVAARPEAAAGAQPAGTAAALQSEIARLEASFDGGVTMTIQARGLLVEMAWNDSSGKTELRWAGAGQVRLSIAGLRSEGQPDGAAAAQRWDLTADAFSLISLPGDSISTAVHLPGPAAAARPTVLPQSVAPTLLMTVDGRAVLVEWDQPVKKPDVVPAPPEAARLTCLFNRGLFEFARIAEQPVPPVSLDNAGAQANAPRLRRAWLDMQEPARPDDELCRALDTDAAFYVRHERAVLERLGVAELWPGPLAQDAFLPAVIAFGPRLAVIPAQTPATAGATGLVGMPASAGTARIGAAAIMLDQDERGFQAWAVSVDPQTSTWQDGVRKVEAEALELRGGGLTLHGKQRLIESGVQR